MKKLSIVFLAVFFFVFGGFIVSRVVNADSSTNSFPFFPMNYNNGSNSVGCGRGYMMYDDDDEIDETYLVLFPSLEGIDSLAGEVFTITVVNADNTVYFTDDVTANPSGAVGVYVPVDFNGSVFVAYGDFTGSTDIDFTDTIPCLVFRVSVTLN